MKKIFTIILLLGILTTPLVASAQFGKALTNMKVVGDKTDLTNNFAGSVSTVIVGVLSLAGTIFLVLTVYAGILWMTAAGNEDQVTKAKDIVSQAVIGLAITLAAYAITAFVTGKLNPTPTAAPSSAIPSAPVPPAITTLEMCAAATVGQDFGGCSAACPSGYKKIGDCLGNADKNLCCGKI